VVGDGYRLGMSDNERLIHASVDDVFAVLTDGWSYASWVVGASRIRDVDPGWPQPGCSIHHSVGVWPLLLNDTTTVEEYEPLRLLRLTVRAWPTGEGIVEFVTTEKDCQCHLTMHEHSSKGPAAPRSEGGGLAQSAGTHRGRPTAGQLASIDPASAQFDTRRCRTSSTR
jgi:uncharacterized protein YndB with AHSA1/START domain